MRRDRGIAQKALKQGFVITLQRDEIGRKRITRQALEDAARIGAAIDVIANRHSETIGDRVGVEIAGNLFDHEVEKIRPAMTLISVGPNQHGLPDKKAVELYENYSSGSDKGNKAYTTEQKKNMKIELKDDGGWWLQE